MSYLTNVNGLRYTADDNQFFRDPAMSYAKHLAIVMHAERVRDYVEALRRDNAELRNELASLKHQTQWECSCGGTDCEGMKENAKLRRLLREATTSLVRHRAAMAKEDKP